MKSARWLSLLLLTGISVVTFAGDIQVSCSPGHSIFLDDKFKGISSADQDGLFLAKVPVGAHTIRVEKDGFLPKNIRIEVSDYPIEVRVGNLSPQPFAQYTKKAEPEEVKQLFGELVVTSAPQNCVIELDGESETKEIPQLSVGRIAAGEHTISFSKPGYETITDVFNVYAGADVTVRGDLFAGKVEVIYEGRGALRVISKPQKCTVRFRGKTEEKTYTRLNITHIPAGQYSIEVAIPGRELITSVWIRDAQRTVLEVDFMNQDEPFVVTHVPN